MSNGLTLPTIEPAPFWYVQKFVGPLGEVEMLPGPVGTKIDLDRGAMTGTCILAATCKDREGEVIDCSGVRYEQHRLNPVVMLDHGRRYPLPIGINRTPEGLYTVYYDPDLDEIRQTTRFSQKTQMGHQVYGLIDEGMLNANSLGFQTITATPMGRAKPDGKPAMNVKTSWMLESSWTALPVNPEAVRKAIEMKWDGKALLPELVSVLEPWAEQPKVWSNGANLGGKAMEASGKVPPTDPDAVKQDPSGDVTQPIETSDEPHSAQAHRMIYDHCKSMLAMHEERMPEMMAQVDPLEHEAAKKFLSNHLEKMKSMIDGHMARQEEAFEKHHPDLPPLAPEGESKKEEKEEEEKKKAEGKSEETNPTVEPSLPREGPISSTGQDSLTGKSMTALGETGGGAMMPPPYHAPMAKAADWLMDLGHDSNHPNLNHGQKAACMYHGEKMKSLMSGGMSAGFKSLTPEEEAEANAKAEEDRLVEAAIVEAEKNLSRAERRLRIAAAS